MHAKKIIYSIFKKYKVTSILFTNKNELFYLTKTQFLEFWLLFINKHKYIICSKIIENQIKKTFNNSDINIVISKYRSFLDITTEILKKHKSDTLLVDLKYINADCLIAIDKKLNNNRINVKKEIGILDNIRIIKTKDEINNLKRSSLIISNICNTIRKYIKPGLTELDIHYTVLELLARNRVKESFTPIIASGENSANPHHISSNRKIKNNDILLIDIGCIYNGYCSDLTRTYFLGNIYDGEYKKVFETIKKVHLNIIKMIKDCVKISYINKIVNKIINKSGYKNMIIHSVAHGIGIEIHEAPYFNKNYNNCTELKKYMTIAVEPGIYINDKFGIRIEDTVLVKKKKSEILTSATY
ncbi:MAG: M24 family metallopeptidase [Endomicrobium sp.]|nr:M24 family metallopeptidase [Endomicrobium sp.]